MREETGRHLAFLDGWRGLAISFVLLGHFWADQALWSRTSGFGVDLFFVLSGRLMGEILFVRQTPLRTFFSRRISRVYPGLLAFVILVSVAFSATAYAHGGLAIATALTFTLNYTMVYFHPIDLLDHLWSLCVEEHGYILLAGLALIYRHRPYSIATVIVAIGLLALVNGMVRVDYLHQTPLFVRWRTDVSISGLFIAAALWIKFRTVKMNGIISPLAFIIAISCSYAKFVQDPQISIIFLAISVVSIDQSYSFFRRALAGTIITRIGLWSYSIYLWQQPFYKLYRDSAAPVWVLLVAAFACALASFYVVERPARNWLNRRFAPVLRPLATG